MEYIMLNEYLRNNLYKQTKENEKYLTKVLTNNNFSEWNEKLETFTHICDLYDYVFHFYENGRIVMEDRILEDSNCKWKGKSECGHLEYLSIDEMLVDWFDEIKNDEGAQTLLKDKIKFIERLKKEKNNTHVRSRDIVEAIENNRELTDKEKEFIKEKWEPKPLVKSSDYESMRCPSCNTVILYGNGHFCIQCGQKIVLHW